MRRVAESTTLRSQTSTVHTNAEPPTYHTLISNLIQRSSSHKNLNLRQQAHFPDVLTVKFTKRAPHNDQKKYYLFVETILIHSLAYVPCILHVS